MQVQTWLTCGVLPTISGNESALMINPDCGLLVASSGHNVASFDNIKILIRI